jgi:hypothetical protein
MTVSRILGSALLALSVCCAGVGCKSTNPESSALSSVVIRGSTPGQINNVVEKVFTRDGYKMKQKGLTTMVLEKEASFASNVAYGNWLTPVTLRAKTKIVPIGEGSWRLECNGFRVRDAGSTVEEEMKMGHSSHKPFDKLLKEVAAELGNQ